MSIYPLTDPDGNQYVDMLLEIYYGLGEGTDDELYWFTALNNSVPAWLRRQIYESANDNHLSPFVILKAIATTLAIVSVDNRETTTGLFLENTTGTDLDFVGAERKITRIVDEDDISYRNRIRKFWQPPDSSLLEISLNQKFAQWGRFHVFEVPYCYFAADNPVDGGYLGNNAILLPPTEFSTQGRSDYHAIVVYIDLIQCLTTEIESQIQEVVDQYRAMGVCSFLFAYSKTQVCSNFSV